jgi:hypothetical protein
MSAQKFSTTSRYFAVEVVQLTRQDGRVVSYLKRRFLPPVERFSVIAEHRVSDGQRLDHIAATHLGDPEQFWRIADANGALHPRDLLEVDRTLNITLPEGIPGLPSD